MCLVCFVCLVFWLLVLLIFSELSEDVLLLIEKVKNRRVLPPVVKHPRIDGDFDKIKLAAVKDKGSMPIKEYPRPAFVHPSHPEIIYGENTKVKEEPNQDTAPVQEQQMEQTQQQTPMPPQSQSTQQLPPGVQQRVGIAQPMQSTGVHPMGGNMGHPIPPGTHMASQGMQRQMGYAPSYRHVYQYNPNDPNMRRQPVVPPYVRPTGYPPQMQQAGYRMSYRYSTVVAPNAPQYNGMVRVAHQPGYATPQYYRANPGYPPHQQNPTV